MVTIRTRWRRRLLHMLTRLLQRILTPGRLTFACLLCWPLVIWESDVWDSSIHALQQQFGVCHDHIHTEVPEQHIIVIERCSRRLCCAAFDGLVNEGHHVLSLLLSLGRAVALHILNNCEPLLDKDIQSQDSASKCFYLVVCAALCALMEEYMKSMGDVTGSLVELLKKQLCLPGND